MKPKKKVQFETEDVAKFGDDELLTHYNQLIKLLDKNNGLITMINVKRVGVVLIKIHFALEEIKKRSPQSYEYLVHETTIAKTLHELKIDTNE